MVNQTAFGRRVGVLGGLLAVCVCGSLVVFGGLPALAHAEGCPAEPLEIPEEMPQPEREIRGLRNDVRETCLAESAELQRIGNVLDGVNADADEIRNATQAAQALLGQEGGLPVKLAGQSAVIETTSAGGGSETVTVANLEGVENAVTQDAETVNSALWGIAGLFVGFLLLGVVFKLVRP